MKTIKDNEQYEKELGELVDMICEHVREHGKKWDARYLNSTLTTYRCSLARNEHFKITISTHNGLSMDVSNGSLTQEPILTEHQYEKLKDTFKYFETENKAAKLIEEDKEVISNVSGLLQRFKKILKKR